MFGLLSRWKRPRLLRIYLDQPAEGGMICNPQLEVRGWLAFDKPFELLSQLMHEFCTWRNLVIVKKLCYFLSLS